MEEKFLKTRAEREEARRQKSAEFSRSALDRQQFEDQARNYERSVLQFLADGNTSAAQETVNIFKSLVQDATGNNVLTAHEMAKSNTTLSRLQGLINEKRDSFNNTKGFKFSRKPRTEATAVVNSLPAAASTPSLSSSGRQSEEDRGHVRNAYGNARDREVFISEPRAVFLQECENCKIFILPVAGSVFISNCSNCKVYVGCHQLRLKNCTALDIYVWCASTPIIEHCTEMRFGPYSCWAGLLQSSVAGHRYPTHEEWVYHVGEQEVHEHVKDSYKRIDDFQWLKKTPSPHWSVLPPEKWEMSARPFP